MDDRFCIILLGDVVGPRDVVHPRELAIAFETIMVGLDEVFSSMEWRQQLLSVLQLQCSYGIDAVFLRGATGQTDPSLILWWLS